MLSAEAGAGAYRTRPNARWRALRAGALALALLGSAMTPALSAQGGTERVSVDTGGEDPDGASSGAAVSADGRYVAFASEAEDLVARDGKAVGGLVGDFEREPVRGGAGRVRKADRSVRAPLRRANLGADDGEATGGVAPTVAFRDLEVPPETREV